MNFDEALDASLPKHERAASHDMRVLVIDIETAPTLAWVWGLFKQNVGINQIEQPGYVLCWAAKWLHHKSKVEFRSLYHDGHDTMVRRAHDLLSEADAVISYNGRAFDIPTLHYEFLKAELAPPAPHQDIDLLASMKKLRKPSNKLDFVVRDLGISDGKLDTGGFETWRGCMENDADAWARMRRYNIQDVKITEALYWRVLPWISGHPTPSVFEGDPGVGPRCGHCGSSELVSAGYYTTRSARYPQFQCRSCGSWTRLSTSERQPRGASRGRGVR